MTTGDCFGWIGTSWFSGFFQPGRTWTLVYLNRKYNRLETPCVFNSSTYTGIHSRVLNLHQVCRPDWWRHRLLRSLKMWYIQDAVWNVLLLLSYSKHTQLFFCTNFKLGVKTVWERLQSDAANVRVRRSGQERLTAGWQATPALFIYTPPSDPMLPACALLQMRLICWSVSGCLGSATMTRLRYERFHLGATFHLQSK